MNIKRLVLAIAVAFIVIWGTDFLIHGLWLAPVYAASMQLWRPLAERQGLIGWAIGGQVLAATAFVVLWARGFVDCGSLKNAVIFGVFMALFNQSATLISYAATPLTLEMVWKWFVGGTLQGIAVGIATFLAYRPASASASPPAE